MLEDAGVWWVRLRKKLTLSKACGIYHQPASTSKLLLTIVVVDRRARQLKL
jgi:hypothetical protein